MSTYVCTTLFPSLVATIGRSGCSTLDNIALVAGAAVALYGAAAAAPHVFRRVRRKARRHDFWESRGYALKQERMTKDGPRAVWRYPTFRWRSLRYGRRRIRRAVLEVRFLANVTRKTVESDLDAISIAFNRRFFKVEADPEDPSLYRFYAAAVPERVDFKDLPTPKRPWTTCIGLSERLKPVILDLRASSCGGIFAPTRSGKTVLAYAFARGVQQSTPHVRVVAVSVKNLATFRNLPGCECLNALRISDMSRLLDLIREWRASAFRLNDLIDQHGVESIEDLYDLGVLDPRLEPRWLWILDEAPAYLQTRKASRDASDLDNAHAEIARFLGEWANQMGVLSRFALICAQSGRTDRVPQELVDNAGFRLVGRQANDAMSIALLGVDRAAREALPQGVFLLRDESGEVTKLRIPYLALSKGTSETKGGTAP